MGMERKLAAILSTDVTGYSRLMGEDEVATIRTLTAYRALMATLIPQHRGRVVDAPEECRVASPPPHGISHRPEPRRCDRGGGTDLWGWRQHRGPARSLGGAGRRAGLPDGPRAGPRQAAVHVRG